MRTQIMPTDPSDSTQGRTRPARQDVDGRLSEGSTLGHYTIRRIIGSGGMGRVYEARQENPRRTVAIKVMSRGITSASALRRFEFEAQVLGRLRHPGIAQILEAGRMDDGATPWFAMEYIANAKPITDYARDNRLSTRDRVRLFRQACEALAHGHQRGIIHRDLKPSNILVDGAGHVKVIDFGVARSTDSDMAVTTLQTDVGQLVGTVQYMSPEQFDADPNDLDIRSDVYALGVVLYELLTDRAPYELGRKAIHQAARIVREEDPPRPSTIRAALRGDLEVIVGTAMAKDRTRRYGSASELSQDLGRWLEGEAIAARAPGVVETIRRFARRHRAAAAAIATAFVLLTASLVVVIRLLGFANQKNVELERQTTQKDAALAEARDQTQRAERLAAERNDAIGRLGTISYASAMRAGLDAIRSGDVDAARQALADSSDAGLADAERRFEWKLLQAATRTDRLTIPTGAGPVLSVAVSPDARTLASGSADGVIRLWDAVSGAPIAQLKGSGSKVNALAFSPDSRTIASATDDAMVRLWNVGTATAPLAELRGHSAPVRTLVWSPDGRWIASGGADREIRMWDALTHACLRTLTGHTQGVLCLACSPDGARLASGSADRSVRVWDAASGASLRAPSEFDAAVTGVTFLREGESPLANVQPGTPLASTGETVLLSVRIAETGVGAVQGASDDSAIGVALASGALRATDWGFLRPPATGTSSTPTCVAASRDGDTIVAGDDAGVLRVLDPALPDAVPTLPLLDATPSVMLRVPGPSPWLLVGARDGRTMLVDAIAARPLASMSRCGDSITALAATRDGRLLARGSRDGHLDLWDGVTGAAVATLQDHGQAISSLAFSGDGRTLAAADGSGRLQFIDLGTRSAFATLTERGPAITALRFTADGALLFSGGADGSVRAWDPASRREVGTLGGHDQAVTSIALSPDERELASSGLDGTVRLWNIASRSAGLVLRQGDRGVQSVAFDPAGSTIAAAVEDGCVRLWDRASGRTLGELRTGAGASASIAFDPSGSFLAVAGDAGVALVRAAPRGASTRDRIALERSIASLQPTVRSWMQAGGGERAAQGIDRAAAADQPALRDLLLLEGPSGLR